ncbi:MAG: anthranilate synthase component I [Planctomycetota bacterium]
MPSFPDIQTFRRLAAAPASAGFRLVPVYRRLFSDSLTPVLAYRRLVRPDDRMAPSFLLESVEGGDRAARYSFVGAQPIVEVLAKGHEVTLRDHRAETQDATTTFHSDDPLGEMDRITADWQFVPVEGLPDFTGGWVGFAGYDTVRYLEGGKLSDPPTDDRHLPDLHMQLYNDVVAFDHIQKCVLVITHVRVEADDDLDAAYAMGCQQLDRLVQRLTIPAVDDVGRGEELSTGHVDLTAPPPALPDSAMGEGGYQDAVRKSKEYIAAGDVFQVVPSQRFRVQTQADPFDVYRALRVINPSPYMVYLQVEGGMLVASSPEILCRVKDGKVVNRPLAGTRRRGATTAEDESLEQELLADPKDLAEHVMLVDLGRNDIGRVARAGSVAMPALMEVERYSHVMHLSSTVTGELRSGLTCWDALRHTLPVGTVSGAPKVRAMQIIDELEPVKRGPYAGAVGYADFAGNMDMAIALRTMVVTPDASDAGIAGWTVDIQAGAGIVADSDPDLEHEETVNKSAALARAVQLAEQSFGPSSG